MEEVIMAPSVEFVRPLDSALLELKSICSKAGIDIQHEVDVNKGLGVKLQGIVNNQPFAVVLYFNRGKGLSSKIVFEKFPEERKSEFIQSLSPGISSKVKAIPIHASITIVDKDARLKIRESFDVAYTGLIEYAKQDHIDYLIKIASSGDELTITQYSTGTLLLQGSYSDLVDRVVDIIDRHKPLSTEERTLLYVPEENKRMVSDKINEKIEVFENALAEVVAQSTDYSGFLFENDRRTLITGDCLVDILEGHDKELPEYNFLVAIFSKVFEGFILKMMIEKEFFTLDQYGSNPDIADIGNALRKKKFSKYIKDDRRYGFVLEDLISVWEGCRCKEMHSDPIAKHDIVTISSLSEAKDKRGKILSCMKDAFNILIKHGYTDKDLNQSKLNKNDLVVELIPKADTIKNKAETADETITYPLAETHKITLKIDDKKQNGYIGTDESGKGDYFGPLVVAGVYLDKTTERRLADIGIRDSKTITDSRIYEFAKIIRSVLNAKQYSVIAIGPEKYNELYAKIGNLNKLLAWGHARTIENILGGVECNTAIADQFGDESLINKALLEKGKKIELIQMPKAEQHIAVAAASVLAREMFLSRLAQMSKDFGIVFPKGASAEVEAIAKRFVQKNGMSELSKCAKIHFKTTQKISM